MPAPRRKNLTCWSCEKPLLVKDIAEERKRFPGVTYEYLCKTCKQAQLDAFVDKTRKGLGLPPLR